MASDSYMKIVKIEPAFNPSSGLFALTCAELPGLFLAGKDLPALINDVPNVIRSLYKLDYGMNVIVKMVSDQVNLESSSAPAVVAEAAVPPLDAEDARTLADMIDGFWAEIFLDEK